MDLNKLANIAIVKDHLQTLSMNINSVSKGMKKQVQDKLKELDQMFLNEVLKSETKEVVVKVEKAKTSVKKISDVKKSNAEQVESQKTKQQKKDKVQPDVSADEDAELLAASLEKAKKDLQAKSSEKKPSFKREAVKE